MYPPDPENGYCKGTRFDWSAAIYSLKHIEAFRINAPCPRQLRRPAAGFRAVSGQGSGAGCTGPRCRDLWTLAWGGLRGDLANERWPARAQTDGTISRRRKATPRQEKWSLWPPKVHRQFEFGPEIDRPLPLHRLSGDLGCCHINSFQRGSSFGRTVCTRTSCNAIVSARTACGIA